MRPIKIFGVSTAVGMLIGAGVYASVSREIRMRESWFDPKDRMVVRLRFEGTTSEAVYSLKNKEWVKAERASGPDESVARCAKVEGATAELDRFENDSLVYVDWEGVATTADHHDFQVDPGWYRIAATFSPDPEQTHPRELWQCTSAPFHVDKFGFYRDVD